MERDLKVLLTVDDNSYKITIKTRGFANAVPFSEFKHFLDDKHRQLFHDVNYAWRIYDADFGEYVALENTSMIYDLSKIKAVREEDRLQGNVDINPNTFEYNRNKQNYTTNQNHNQMPIERRDTARPPCQPQMDLRDFVASSFTAPQTNRQNPMSVNTFDSYYPNRLPIVSPVVQNLFNPPMYSTPGHLREVGFRMSSPPREIPMDLNYSASNSFNYSSDSHRMSSSSYPEMPHSRSVEKDSLFYRSAQRELYPHSSKRHKSPESPRTSNRNRVLSTPLYLKRTLSHEKKVSPRPLSKLMKPSSPIRERSKKLSEASKRILHQRLTAASAERKLTVKVTKSTTSAKDSKSQKQGKQVPNCVRALDAKRRDYFKVEDKLLGKALINAVKKYNDEFTTIAMCEDIWQTNRIWTYIAKELSTASDVYLKPTRKAIRCRRYFRGMLRRYLIILEDFWNWSEFEAQELWPFFEFFHKQLDLTPFDKDVARLKESFIKKVKPVKHAKENKSNSDAESKNKKKEGQKQFVFDEKHDMRLLMAVSEHIEDFRKDTILESDVWTEVAVDLNDPPILDPTLLEKSRIKWETRFYSLLSEFQKLMKKETPLSSSERTLKFLFDKLDITPFLKEDNESDDDSASNASLEELGNDIVTESNAEVIAVDDEVIDTEKKVLTSNEESVKQVDEEMKDISIEAADKKEEIIERLTIDETETAQTETSECLKTELLDAMNTEAKIGEVEDEVTQNKSADVDNDVKEMEERMTNESENEISNLNEDASENQGNADCEISSIDATNSVITEEENNAYAIDLTTQMKEEEDDAITGDTVTTEKKEAENKIVEATNESLNNGVEQEKKNETPPESADVNEKMNNPQEDLVELKTEEKRNSVEPEVEMITPD